MSSSQALYLAGLFFYALVLMLFCRYFLWRRYSYRRYWRHRPHLSCYSLRRLAKEQGRDLPFISILVPARNEAEVIGNTIEHLASLKYPTNRLEIMVISDEKELLGLEATMPGNAIQPSTTYDVVEAKMREFNKRGNGPVLKHAIVPCDFDGRFGGMNLGRLVSSTKGRALNFGLGFIDPRAEICGFYDAESRPEEDVLLYVAYRRLLDPAIKIWQGAVFQVRNFFQLSPVTKVVALFQAVSHEWYLPVLMRQLPFVGGTNLFVDRKLLERIGGYDRQALTEDLELGVRAWLEEGTWPEYIPYASTEQTPPTYQHYFRQRLRWGSGHLQVTDKFRQGRWSCYPNERLEPVLHALFWKGQGEWIIYQLLILAPLVLVLLAILGKMDDTLLPAYLRLALSFNLPLYFGFIGYVFWHFHGYIDFSVVPSWWQRVVGIAELVVLPLAGFLVPLPFTVAVLLKWLNRQPTAWIKTPRTRETPRYDRAG